MHERPELRDIDRADGQSSSSRLHVLLPRLLRTAVHLDAHLCTPLQGAQGPTLTYYEYTTGSNDQAATPSDFLTCFLPTCTRLSQEASVTFSL